MANVFLKKILSVFAALMLLSVALGYLCYQWVNVSVEIGEPSNDRFAWQPVLDSDEAVGGGSSIRALEPESEAAIGFVYRVTQDMDYPYATYLLAFANRQDEYALTDLSSFSRVSFDIRCSESNLLSLDLHTFDDQVSQKREFYTYRVAKHLFTCGEQWSEMSVDLAHLRVPLWWLESNDLPVSDDAYQLDKTFGLSFGASRQGPVDRETSVVIRDLTLERLDWRYFYGYVALLILVWGGYAVWVAKRSRCTFKTGLNRV